MLFPHRAMEVNLKTSEIAHKNGVALNGYDVAAYHKLGKARKGNKRYTCRWKGLEWYFINEVHLKLFRSDPEKFVPAYGGYCAFGASQGYKAPSKPDAFHIHDGILYLNFAKYVQKRWLEKKSDRIIRASKNWPQVRSQKQIKARPIPIWWKYKILKLFGRDILR